jgi:hypothetical protein
MTFITHQSQIRTIRSNDPRFCIRDKFVTTPRAGFEIQQQCPVEYKSIIIECINRGWLKPVANMTERELIFTGLSSE